MCGPPGAWCSPATPLRSTTGRRISSLKRAPWATLRRLFRLALSADIFVRCSSVVAAALCDRLRDLAVATFPAYLLAVRIIIGDRIGYLLAAAFPAVLSNFVVGQNGFLSRLVGGALVLLERRPVWAGVLLGLLTYKPHLGLLFPIALVAGGYWRAFFRRAIVATLMVAASLIAFGADAWHAFFGNIGHTSQAFLSEGWADFGKLQTALDWPARSAAARYWRGPCKPRSHSRPQQRSSLLWRSRAPYEIKAAALGVGAMLATPYLYTYDLVVLAVPLAFLFRLGRARGFLAHELAGIGLACLLILIFPFVKAPVGFAAVLVVAALIGHRALSAKHALSAAA